MAPIERIELFDDGQSGHWSTISTFLMRKAAKQPRNMPASGTNWRGGLEVPSSKRTLLLTLYTSSRTP
jgi:hypothetical protein